MAHRLRTDRKNIQKMKEKYLAVSADRPKVPKKLSNKVAKEKYATFCESVFKRIEAQLEVVELPVAAKNYEPVDDVLAARVEALYKQLGEVSARVVRHREEVPPIVDKLVSSELQARSAAAIVPPPPVELTVPAPIPARLREGVERNYGDLINTLTHLDESYAIWRRRIDLRTRYPEILEKARRIKAVAEQRSKSKTEAVIQEEIKTTTVASPRSRSSPASKKTPIKRR